MTRRLVLIEDNYEHTTRRRLADYLGTLVPGGVSEAEVSRALEAIGLDLGQVDEEDLDELGLLPEPEITFAQIGEALGADLLAQGVDPVDEVRDLRLLAEWCQKTIVDPKIPRGRTAAQLQPADDLKWDLEYRLATADDCWTRLLALAGRLGIEVPQGPPVTVEHKRGKTVVTETRIPVSKVYGYTDGDDWENPTLVIEALEDWVTEWEKTRG